MLKIRPSGDLEVEAAVTCSFCKDVTSWLVLVTVKVEIVTLDAEDTTLWGP
jgi:hypothetical protein